MSPPIRCRAPWKIQKRTSDSDRWLDEMGYFRKHTARDSSCLFRAVSENIYSTQRYFHKVRLDCVHFMASYRHLFEGSLNCPFDNYLKEMSNPSEYGGLTEISAMSHLYRRDFVIFEANQGPQTKICNGYGVTISLFYTPETKHFDVVYTKEFINASSFCQSLVYEILYDGVYHLKDLPYAVDKMLHYKVPNSHIEYFMSENVERRKKQKERAKIFIETPNEGDKDDNNNALAIKCKHHIGETDKSGLLKESMSIFVFNRSLIHLENVCMSCLNVNSAKDLLQNGITPFPYKVAKALDPDIYRNIEFDVWTELRREVCYRARYCDGTTLQVGVKCLCKLQPNQTDPYHCHIQEMKTDGPCLVFIEELGEKQYVNYDQLELLPLEQVKPWAPPYRYARSNSQIINLSQMLQQIGNMTRKQVFAKRTKSKDEMKEAKPSESPGFQYYTYPHRDYMNFQPVPVELRAFPLMVDCRPAGAPPQDIPHSNGASENQTQAGPTADMAAHGVSVPTSVRASTPATTNAISTFTPNYNGSMTPALAPSYCAPYCGVKSLVWCAPHMTHAPHVPPMPPPPPVNLHVHKSVQPSGSDLPMNDIATLRFYFNLGVDCMWATYGPPPPPPQPPRHYAPRDLPVQEMQQMSIHDRPLVHDHKQKPQDNKLPLAQQKGNNGQRTLLGPRFKRGNNQDGGNQNNNHNKGPNNTMPNNNKGPNNRRNSYTDTRYMNPATAMTSVVEECPEPSLVTIPYIPYPPPVYAPMPYYHVDSDPAMMGVMGAYMGYEDGVEYAPVQHYYPPPYPPQPPPHLDHK